MYYVYIIQSIKFPKEHYVGFSEDLKTRIKDYNNGKSTHTNKFKPWELIFYTAFKGLQTAREYETYLKRGSGRAFLKKHLIK
ncbi:MAG: GIY-YIG nuclease family protein [Candidatus Doudnabacteria bacterium]|nr:GIY-YIG nuclease family protein [Candidatus Doudnabacteria bacterium]